MRVVPNFLLCLTVSLSMVGCQDLAKQIDKEINQARKVANEVAKLEHPILKRPSPINTTPSPGGADANQPMRRGQQPLGMQIPTEGSVQQMLPGMKKGSGTWNTATSVEGKCQALLDWLSQLEREYPETYKERTSGARPTWPIGQYANLFRDKYFVPVFGVTYQQMDEADRSALLYTVERPEKGQCALEYGDKLRPYLNLFITTFAPSQSVTRTTEDTRIFHLLKNMNAEEERIKKGTTQIEQMSPSEGNLTQLLNELNLENGRSRGGGDAILQWKPEFVWPSERAAFQEVVRNKAKEIALRLLEQAEAETAQLSPSPTNAKLINNELKKTVTYMAVLGDTPEAQARQAALRNKADDMLRKYFSEPLKQLAFIPNKWAGVEASQKWHSEFRQDLDELGTLPTLKQVDDEFSQKRERIFQGAKKEFQAKVTAIQSSGSANMGKADELLRATFSLPGDQLLQSYGEYKKIVPAYQANAQSEGQSPVVPRRERQQLGHAEFTERYSLKTEANEKPYWTSETGDVIVKMSREPWCIKNRNGLIEVHTTDSTLYQEKNSRLQTIFSKLSGPIRKECPGIKDLVLNGYLNTERVFYSWVDLTAGGQIVARSDVRKDQQNRPAAE